MTIAPDLTTGTVWSLPNPRHGWALQAACRGTDPEAFVVSRSSTQNKQAIAICDTCPVVMDCRVDAVRTDDQSSIRGAMTPSKRNQWLKDQDITRGGHTSPASQKNPRDRVGRKIRLDVPRIIHMRQTGEATFAEIAAAVGCTERTAARRYAEWERQQPAVEQAGRIA